MLILKEQVEKDLKESWKRHLDHLQNQRFSGSLMSACNSFCMLGSIRLVRTGVCLPQRTQSKKVLCSVLCSTGTK